MLGRTYFTYFCYQKFLVYAPILSSLILDSFKKVTNWTSTQILSEKFKPFDTNPESIMSNLANDRVTLEFNNSILAQKTLLHFIVILF